MHGQFAFDIGLIGAFFSKIDLSKIADVSVKVAVGN